MARGILATLSHWNTILRCSAWVYTTAFGKGIDMSQTTERATAIAGDRRSVPTGTAEHFAAIRGHPICQVCERRASTSTIELCGPTAVCARCRDLMKV
jgi:hypothetical protein